MSVVDLSNRPIDAPLPPDDTPLAVLEELVAQIKSGTQSPIRIVIAIETDEGYRNRTSRMTNSEAVCLLTVAARLTVDSILDI